MSIGDLRDAAQVLYTALDPAVTPHAKYERLMLDLAWPVKLADLLLDVADSLAEDGGVVQDSTTEAAVVVAKAILRAKP